MAKFTDLPKSEWRKDADRVIWRKVTSEVYSTYDTFSIQDLIDLTQKQSLSDVTFEVDRESTYYDQERAFVTMIGWRVADPVEVKEALVAVDQGRSEMAQRKAAHEAKLIDDLKKVRPELFK